MQISDRTKRLLNWWRLRIEKSHEESKKENDERNDTTADSTAGVCVGNKDNERQRVRQELFGLVSYQHSL